MNYEEIAAAVKAINIETVEVTGDSDIYLELKTNGWASLVEFGCFRLWSSEDDDRIDYGDDTMEDIESCLRRKMKEIAKSLQIFL